MKETELTALCVVAILIVFDYATGLMKAVKQHDVSSEKMRDGMWHKAGIVLIMALAEVIEHAQPHIDLGFTVPIVVPAAVYIAITEISSIIENIGELNPELKASALLQLFRINEKDKPADEILTDKPRHAA